MPERASRAYWKGYLRLSLVTVGVELYSAVTARRELAFHQIHKPSGKRIRYEKVAPGIGPVDASDIVKGVEVEKDEYVVLEPKELDAVQLESKRTIDLVQFVERCDIDPRYFEKPYYVVPADNEVAVQGFAVLREGLRAAKRVALGQMAVRGRDSIVAIDVCGEGLLLETLRYADELKQSDRIFRDIPPADVDAEMLALAAELIERKSAPFAPEKFKSHYEEAVLDLIDKKRRTGRSVAVRNEEQPRQGNVIDLMEALRKSLDGDRPAGAAKSRAPASKPRAAAAKRKASPRKTARR